MFSHLRPALATVLLFTALLGLGYPLAITGVAQAAFPAQADGSLIRDGEGRVVGSALIGQAFASPAYLHGRPSAAGEGYDASASGGSNLGPLSPKLAERVTADAERVRRIEAVTVVPGDAVTASGSGLDPHISPAYARDQVRRIARARNAPEGEVRAIIEAHVEDRTFGVLGQPRLNVLQTNLALDSRFPVRADGA